MVDAATAEFSVDDLAAASGVSVRTIRYYQSEGLLPSPIRQGREVRYGAEHVERLKLVAELQARGLRLTAIADLLQNASADEWLGLGEELSRPWSDDHAVVLSEPELAERLDSIPVADAVRVGLAERRADTMPVVYFVPSPGLLEVAVASTRLGLDLDTAARLRDVLERNLRAAATDLVATFTEEVSAERLAGDGPAQLADLLEQLRPLTRRTVALLFAHEMERAQQELLP